MLAEYNDHSGYWFMEVVYTDGVRVRSDNTYAANCAQWSWYFQASDLGKIASINRINVHTGEVVAMELVK